jgi:glycosyltransferase involved in cell wall biosynthesis
MNSIPLVSVGLFVYNGERFLAETIESILNQTLTDFELIISDNASTDRTGEIAEAYSKRDDRIRYYPTWTAGRDFAIENGRNAGG